MDSLHIPPPSEQVYRSFVPQKYDGLPIEKYFASRFDYWTESEWILHIGAGMVTVNGNIVSPGVRILKQDHIITRMGARTEPPANRKLDVVYEDRNIRVFNKSAPIPVHPCGRYFRNSMTELLKEEYADEGPRPVQRLDATTTCLIIFARNRQTAAFLMEEFQQNRVHKEYFALVEGIPKQNRFVIEAPIGKIKGSKRGIGKGILKPKAAETDVEWLSTLGELSLLKVVPRSGRTNQIRVHLASAGLPMFNDSVYGDGRNSFTEFGLHAGRLRFNCIDRSMDLRAGCPLHFKPLITAAKRNAL